jgi:WD40 repeat protein
MIPLTVPTFFVANLISGCTLCTMSPVIQGGINCLAIAGAALVSGGSDCTLRVWNFNTQAGIFMSQVRTDCLNE